MAEAPFLPPEGEQAPWIIENGKTAEQREREEKREFTKRMRFLAHLQRLRESLKAHEKIVGLMTGMKALRNRPLSIATQEVNSDLDTTLNREDIKILEEIAAIEALENIETLLPKPLRLCAEDFQSALSDREKTKKALTQVQNALQYCYSSSPNAAKRGGLFGGIKGPVKAEIVRIQEHNIDLKRRLSHL